MRRTISLVAILVLGECVSACGGYAVVSPTQAVSAKYGAVLQPENEVPATTGAEAAGSGASAVTFNLVTDAYGTTTAATLDVSVTAAGFPNGTALTDAHIHAGAAGANGGIIVSFGLTAGEVTFPTGVGSFTKTGIALSVDLANAIAANPGAFYVNIHTAANPGGVARGQLARVQ